MNMQLLKAKWNMLCDLMDDIDITLAKQNLLTWQLDLIQDEVGEDVTMMWMEE